MKTAYKKPFIETVSIRFTPQLNNGTVEINSNSVRTGRASSAATREASGWEWDDEEADPE